MITALNARNEGLYEIHQPFGAHSNPVQSDLIHADYHFARYRLVRPRNWSRAADVNAVSVTDHHCDNRSVLYCHPYVCKRQFCILNLLGINDIFHSSFPPPPPPLCVCTVFVFPYHRFWDLFFFTTDGYGIFNVRTHTFWVRAVHTMAGHAQTNRSAQEFWDLRFGDLCSIVYSIDFSL